MKKQIERLREDARRSREKAAHSYESTEMQLNDSLNENRELQGTVRYFLSRIFYFLVLSWLLQKREGNL
jgi:hypothetical protein